MDYKIMIFSSPGCKYNELNFIDLKKFKIVDSVRITKLENIGTLDVKQLFNAIYNGFDGIFVIIRGKIKGDKFISEYNSFQKSVDEANRILKKRGFTNQRISILHWNGSNYKRFNNDINNVFRKIMKCGQNPINKEIMGTQIFNKDRIFRVI